MDNSADRMKAPFNEASFACFDFETTGFSPKRDRVIEVAVVTVTHGTVGPSWTSLINPGDDVELGATHIHGIKRDWIRSAPSFAEIAGTLFSLLDGKVLVAHNANFDLGFLRSEMSRAQLLAKGTLFPHWDTMKAADFAPSLPASRKLVDVAAAFGVEIANAHQGHAFFHVHCGHDLCSTAWGLARPRRAGRPLARAGLQTCLLRRRPYLGSGPALGPTTS